MTGALHFLLACADSTPPSSSDLDHDLATMLSAAGVTALPPPDTDPEELVELGRLLFFDKILSGNKNIACSTCHHLAYHSTDLLSLGIGTGGIRNGPARKLGHGRFLSRNTADLYNKGLASFTSLFHDGRVELANGTLTTPAGSALPSNLTSPLAAQAMFPVTGRDEMRGVPGDTTRFGEINELALVDDRDFAGIWNGLFQRVLSYPDYVARFQEAFPGQELSSMGFEHAALAIAAFERAAFTQLDSPFDRYLAGTLDAMSDSAKRGAVIFYGKGRCESCHAGALLTDQAFHNIGVPQLAAGTGSAALDVGRVTVTGRAGDRFAFRTPSLRNVVLTGPWMHNGAYTLLDNAIRHYRNPVAAYRDYDPSQLDPRIGSLIRLDQATQAEVMATLDTAVTRSIDLTEVDIALIRQFLNALTDPRAFIQLHEIPDQVPSGLPVFE